MALIKMVILLDMFIISTSNTLRNYDIIVSGIEQLPLNNIINHEPERGPHRVEYLRIGKPPVPDDEIKDTIETEDVNNYEAETGEGDNEISDKITQLSDREYYPMHLAARQYSPLLNDQIDNSDSLVRKDNLIKDPQNKDNAVEDTKSHNATGNTHYNPSIPFLEKDTASEPESATIDTIDKYGTFMKWTKKLKSLTTGLESDIVDSPIIPSIEHLLMKASPVGRIFTDLKFPGSVPVFQFTSKSANNRYYENVGRQGKIPLQDVLRSDYAIDLYTSPFQSSFDFVPGSIELPPSERTYSTVNIFGVLNRKRRSLRSVNEVDNIVDDDSSVSTSVVKRQKRQRRPSDRSPNIIRREERGQRRPSHNDIDSSSTLANEVSYETLHPDRQSMGRRPPSNRRGGPRRPAGDEDENNTTEEETHTREPLHEQENPAVPPRQDYDDEFPPFHEEQNKLQHEDYPEEPTNEEQEDYPEEFFEEEHFEESATTPHPRPQNPFGPPSYTCDELYQGTLDENEAIIQFLVHMCPVVEMCELPDEPCPLEHRTPHCDDSFTMGKYECLMCVLCDNQGL